jgi:ABC-2 type transport system permease protein
VIRAALEITRKDLRQRLRDRSAILVGVVAPFVLAALFASILGGVSETFHARWAIVDDDGGSIATALREGPLAGMAGSGQLTLEQLPDEAAARTAIEAGDVDATIHLPTGLSAATVAGSEARIELLVAADATLSGAVARSVLSAFAQEVESVRLAVATVLAASDGPPDLAAIPALTEVASSMPSPIVLRDVAADAREASSATYYAAAMSIFFVFLSAQFGITSLHGERRGGTLARLLASPVRWQAIILGKLAVSAIMAVISMTVIVVGTSVLLGARWGDPLAVAGLVAGAALAATGIALLAVSVTRTEEQASSIVAVVAMVLAILGGTFFPLAQGPEILARLTFLTPHAWFLRGVADASSGAGPAAVVAPVVILGVIGLATGGLGLLRARRLVLD